MIKSTGKMKSEKVSPEDERLEKILKRHTGFLLDEFKGHVSGLAEQFGDIQKTLKSHTKTLNSHTEQIGNILMDTTEIKSDIKRVKLSVTLDVERKVGKKHFVDLDTRVRALEKK